MKNIKLLSLMAVVALGLSGCTLGSKVSEDGMVTEKSQSELSEKAEMPVTPTMAADDSLGGVEADLKSTTILDEDFSDLK